MKLQDLAALMGKTIDELEKELKNNDVIELKLTDKNSKETQDKGGIEILE